MSTLILPRSIKHSNAADHAAVDRFHDDQAYHARALKEGIDRTEKWVRSPLAGWDGETDECVVVRVPGAERVIHVRKDRNAPGGRKVRVFLMTPRPCPGCGKHLYGVGEVETSHGGGAPWHLACWELEEALLGMAVGPELETLEFDDRGLVKAPGRPRPRRRKR